MISTIHTNSTGVIFRMALLEDGNPIDLTGATLTMLFQKPDQTGFERAATAYGPSLDGVLQYTAPNAELDAVGSWRWQAHVVKAGEEWYSDVADFEVLPNLPTV